MELPRYRCHKEVRALKIKEIRRVQEPKFERPVCKGCTMLGNACGHCERCKWREEHGNPGFVIVPEDERYAGVCVAGAYIEKHKPRPGGYYVVYEDGYKSFSPAAAFESGYSRIPLAGTESETLKDSLRISWESASMLRLLGIPYTIDPDGVITLGYPRT